VLFYNLRQCFSFGVEITETQKLFCRVMFYLEKYTALYLQILRWEEMRYLKPEKKIYIYILNATALLHQDSTVTKITE
jgi:hypothetical protein